MVNQKRSKRPTDQDKRTPNQLGLSKNQLEFEIEELPSRLPVGTQVASCRGCKGCKSTDE